MSDTQGNKLDLSEHTDPDILKQLVHQGEVCLSDTVRLAIAADGRATTLCGIFGAAGVALMAAAAGNLASQHVEHAFVVAATIAGSLFICASAIAAFASAPADFFVGGDEPRRLAKVTDTLSQLRHIASDFQMRLDANRIAMRRSSTHAHILANWPSRASLPIHFVRATRQNRTALNLIT
jgi:hypothetical protein